MDGQARECSRRARGNARVRRTSFGLDVPRGCVLLFPSRFIRTDAMADEIPPPPPQAIPQTVPHTPAVAIWSLILAVLSFTCGWLFTAIPAVICGHIAWSKIRKSGGTLGGKNIAIAGLIRG